jgi:leucyl/phenylalanyl-tRNA--protein transferase
MITWLSPRDAPGQFPPAEAALEEPPGLLAAGGDLSPERLLAAYRRGIFPWYSPGQPILWWSPDPREVLLPEEFHVSRSLARRLRRLDFEIRRDHDFAGCMDGCAAPRQRSPGTWITPEMRTAYCRLHELGHAHSVEVWRAGHMIGGVYGVRMGQVFFGESMFSREPDASKIAMAHLVGQCRESGIRLIDCQMPSEHLRRLGSRAIPRSEFLALLAALCAPPPEQPQPKVAAR